ncbi:B-cell receptor CD22-like isoform X2 [Betta splendens]|uniref:B-cell receptor CD22-like isoform X2 n=1 Tax=Betta splendens TaxID=158456 RepID=A0A6P7LG00_BETSP|nr:B-cell receptor CD22-like isoform X2 [Betta splendens]
MAASAAGFLLLLSASVVRGDNGWSVTFTKTEICAVEGVTVQMSCSYEYPSSFKDSIISVERKFWFTRMNENEYVDLKSNPQYDHRVEHQCWNRSCTLTITNVRKSDSGVYRFTFISTHPEGKFTGDPGVTLSVTDDSNLHVNKYYNWLDCSSRCPLPDQRSYIWYENGHELPHQTSYYLENVDSAHSYSCALRGHEAFPAPSVCVSDQTCNKVIYTDRSICAVKGSSVEVSCTYNSHSGSITSTYWFRQSPSQPQDLRTDVQFTGRVQVLEAATGGSTLRISDVTETDSGQYGFTFRAGGFEWGRSLSGPSLTVTVLQVQVITSTLQDSYTDAELRCLSSCSSAARLSYVWFKNGHEVPTEDGSYRGRVHPGDAIVCALKGRENFKSASVYAPDVPSVSVVPSGNILENSLVTLTCSSDANPAANYTWYRDSHPESVHEGPQLVFSSIQSSDSGHFYCVAENQLGRKRSESISVDVRCKAVMIINITRLTLVVLMLIPVFVLSLWMRKKTALISKS